MTLDEQFESIFNWIVGDHASSFESGTLLTTYKDWSYSRESGQIFMVSRHPLSIIPPIPSGTMLVLSSVKMRPSPEPDPDTEITRQMIILNFYWPEKEVELFFRRPLGNDWRIVPYEIMPKMVEATKKKVFFDGD